MAATIQPIIAVDFDGTLCENAWPEIGKPKQAVIEYVCRRQQEGARLILWTNRTGEFLQEAILWCVQHGIAFDAVNENLPEIIKLFNGDCRKIFANEYLDDRAVPVPGSERDLLREMSREVYYIREKLDLPELLAQLAEECAELSQAALKYRRALTGENPTPMGRKEAAANLVEEMADVDLCTSLLKTQEDEQHVHMIARSKLLRWFGRLKEADTRN